MISTEVRSAGTLASTPLNDKLQSQAFLRNFCEDVAHTVENQRYCVDFSDKELQKIRLYLGELIQGKAELIENNPVCRAICLSVTAGIEEMLAKMLRSNEIQQVKIIFITPLPCEQFRQEKYPENKKRIDPLQHVLEKRTRTVRNLRDLGAIICNAYESESFNKFKNSLIEKDKKEVETFERELKEPNMLNAPLNCSIPTELVGTVYHFEDKEGRTYFISTQEVQQISTNHLECWRTWFFEQDFLHPEISRHSVMIDFAKRHSS